jgi:hypothetical protein
MSDQSIDEAHDPPSTAVTVEVNVPSDEGTNGVVIVSQIYQHHPGEISPVVNDTAIYDRNTVHTKRVKRGQFTAITL